MIMPVFDRSPLVSQKSCALNPGQVKASNSCIESVYMLAKQHAQNVRVLEGLIRLSALIEAQPEESLAAQMIREQLAKQQEDGGYDLAIMDQVALNRAALALYYCCGDRKILATITSWCAYVYANWDRYVKDDEFHKTPADFMQLLEEAYKLTGKAGILALCEKCRKACMDWSTILHNFSAHVPFKRVVDKETFLQGIMNENGNTDGYYTHLYLTHKSEALADGVRSAALNGIYSGNGQEISAPRIGYEKISKYHATASGAISADDTLAGSSPSAAIEAASVGAWIEALAIASITDSTLYDDLEKLCVNALPACIVENELIRYQRVNCLVKNPGIMDGMSPSNNTEGNIIAIARLARAWAAIAENTIRATPTGADIMMYRPMQAKVAVQNQGLLLKTEEKNPYTYRYTIQVQNPVSAVLRFRVPDWCNGMTVAVNDIECTTEAEHGMIALRQTWKNGDRIDVSFDLRVRIVEGYHQAQSVFYGPQLFVLPVTEKQYAVSLVDNPSVQNGTVFVTVSPLEGEWKYADGILHDVPVRPKTVNDKQIMQLEAYADTPCRIAAFPKARQSVL